MPRYQVFYETTIVDSQELNADSPEHAREQVERRIKSLYDEVQRVHVSEVWNMENDEVTFWTKGNSNA